MLKIAFFGTPEFSVPFLKALSEDPAFDVVGVVTFPDREAGRGKTLTPPPVKRAADALGIPTLQPPTLRSEKARDSIAGFQADLFVVFAYGKIIPKDVLELPRLGCVNVHPSLLPKYRGPTPMQSAIQNGDPETGITIMLLDEGMDTGPVLATQILPLADDETLGSLTAKLETRGPALLIETLKRLEAGDVVPTPQDSARAVLCGLLTRDNGHLDWSLPAMRVERTVRAYDGWPGTWSLWNGKRIKVLAASVSDPIPNLAAGTVRVQNGRLFVGAADGTLELTRVQPEGGAAMTGAAFASGYSEIDGATLA